VICLALKWRISQLLSFFTSLQEAAAFLFSTKFFAQTAAGFFISAGKSHSSRERRLPKYSL